MTLWRRLRALVPASWRIHDPAVVVTAAQADWPEMAREVAHEIKGPLTAMKLSLALLSKAHEEDDELDDDGSRFDALFERITATLLGEIDALQKVTSDFSAFAGLAPRHPEPVSVASILEECCRLYDGWSSASGITLCRQGDDAVVQADRGELRRLLINLLNNAFEAVGTEGTVRIASSVQDGVLRLVVSDSGPGVPPPVQARLFEPYFSTKATGTGLGLAICRRIVTDMGGTIALSSEPGRPTAVCVQVPALRAAAGGQAWKRDRTAPALRGKTPTWQV